MRGVSPSQRYPKFLIAFKLLLMHGLVLILPYQFITLSFTVKPPSEISKFQIDKMQKTLFAVSVILLVSTIHTRNIKKKNNKDVNTKEEYYKASEFDEVHDQRQNGSENLRFDVNGVDVVIAPARSLFPTFFSPMAILAVLNEYSRRATASLGNRKLPNKREQVLEINPKTNQKNSLQNSRRNRKERM